MRVIAQFVLAIVEVIFWGVVVDRLGEEAVEKIIVKVVSFFWGLESDETV